DSVFVCKWRSLVAYGVTAEMPYLYINYAITRCKRGEKNSPPPGPPRITIDAWIYSQPPTRATILLLLMAACDINPNPGPGDAFFPCGRCNSAVVKGTRGIQCDGCDKWFHAGCVGISQSEYVALASSHDDWYCSPDEKHKKKKRVSTKEKDLNESLYKDFSLTEHKERLISLDKISGNYEECSTFEKTVKNQENDFCEEPLKSDTIQVSSTEINLEIQKNVNISRDAQEINYTVSNDTFSNNMIGSIENSSQSKEIPSESDIVKKGNLEENSSPKIISHNEEMNDSEKVKFLHIKASKQLEKNIKIPGKKKRGRPRKKMEHKEIRVKRKYTKRKKEDPTSFISDKEILSKNPCPTLKKIKICVNRLSPRSFLNPRPYIECGISPESIRNICKLLIKMRSNFRRNYNRRQKRQILKTGGVLPKRFRADFEDPDDAIRLNDIMKKVEKPKPKTKKIIQKKIKDKNSDTLEKLHQLKEGKPQGPPKKIMRIEKEPLNKFSDMPNTLSFGSAPNDTGSPRDIKHKLVSQSQPYVAAYHSPAAPIQRYPTSSYPHHYHYHQQQYMQNRTMTNPSYRTASNLGHGHYERPIAPLVGQQYQTNYAHISPQYQEAAYTLPRRITALGPISPPGLVPSPRLPPASPHMQQHQAGPSIAIHSKPPPLTPMHNYPRISPKLPDTVPVSGVLPSSQAVSSCQAAALLTSQHVNVLSNQPLSLSVTSITPVLAASTRTVPGSSVLGTINVCMSSTNTSDEISKSPTQTLSKSLTTTNAPYFSNPTATHTSTSNSTPVFTHTSTSTFIASSAPSQTCSQPASVPVPVIMKNDSQTAASNCKSLLNLTSSVDDKNKGQEIICKDQSSLLRSYSEGSCSTNSVTRDLISQAVSYSLTTTTTTTTATTTATATAATTAAATGSTSAAIQSYKAYGSYQRHLLYPSAKPEIRYYVKAADMSHPATQHQVVTIPSYNTSTNRQYYAQASSNGHPRSQHPSPHNQSSIQHPNSHHPISHHVSHHQPSSQQGSSSHHVANMATSHSPSTQTSSHRMHHPSILSGHYYTSKNSDPHANSRPHHTMYVSGHHSPGAVVSRKTPIYPRHGYPESRTYVHTYRSYESQLASGKPYKASEMLAYLEQKVLDGAYANIKRSEDYFVMRNQLNSSRVQEILNQYKEQIEQQNSESSLSKNTKIDSGPSELNDSGTRLKSVLMKNYISSDAESLSKKTKNNCESGNNKKSVITTFSLEDDSSNPLKDELEISVSIDENQHKKGLSVDERSSKEFGNSTDVVSQVIHENVKVVSSESNKDSEPSILKLSKNGKSTTLDENL
ncbi:unnamed protein product, partial [Meganyctiphanes norvegica]